MTNLFFPLTDVLSNQLTGSLVKLKPYTSPYYSGSVGNEYATYGGEVTTYTDNSGIAYFNHVIKGIYLLQWSTAGVASASYLNNRYVNTEIYINVPETSGSTVNGFIYKIPQPNTGIYGNIPVSASWASSSLSASYAVSASWAPGLNAVSSSWASASLSSSYSVVSDFANYAQYSVTTTSSSFASQSISSSWAPFVATISASWASSSLSASYAPQVAQVSASWASQSLSASYVPNLYPVTTVQSASWASASLSASWSPNQGATTLVTASTYSITSSWSNSSSFASKSNISISSSWASSSISASYVPNLYPQVEQISASWASSSLFSTSASFASQSISASWAPIVNTLPDITDDTINVFVGINQPAPQYTLDVNGIIGNSNGDIDIEAKSGSIFTPAGHVYINAGDNRDLYGGNVVIDAGEGLNINTHGQILLSPNGGNVGVGYYTPAAQYTLDVNGDINFVNNLYQNGSEYIPTHSLSSSYADRAISASYSNISTSSSYSVTSSFSTKTISSSYANTASFSVSASWAPGGALSTSSSWASQSFWSVSASFASQSLSSSFVNTASFLSGYATFNNVTNSFFPMWTDGTLSTSSALLFLTTSISSSVPISASLIGTASWSNQSVSASYVSGTLGGVMLTNPVFNINGQKINNELGRFYVASGVNAGNIMRTEAGSRYWANGTVFQGSGGFLYDSLGNELLSASVFTATGSLNGTASWSNQSVSASYISGTIDGAILANELVSLAGNRILNNAGQVYVSAGTYIGTTIRSAAGSRKWAINGNTFQDTIGQVFDVNGNTILSASVFTATGSLNGSASYALTASFALNGGSGGASVSASWASSSISSSYAVTASYVAPDTVNYTTLTTSSTNWITTSFNNAKNYINITTGSAYNFTCSNTPSGTQVLSSTVFINNTATATSSLFFPSNWVFIGSVPTSLTSSKSAILSLEAYGSTVVAGFGVSY